MYVGTSTDRRIAPRRSWTLLLVVLLAGAMTVAVGATGVAGGGVAARFDEASTIVSSPDQRQLDELRARLSPELARLLDEVGRLVSLEDLLRAGALDELERPTPLQETDASYLVAEEASEGKPGDLSAKKAI